LSPDAITVGAQMISIDGVANSKQKHARSISKGMKPSEKEVWPCTFSYASCATRTSNSRAIAPRWDETIQKAMGKDRS